MLNHAQDGSAQLISGGPEQPLAALRAELDALDDALHDTLMRRAEVVSRIAALRIKEGTPLRPGREAAILRRLLARHGGSLPRQGVVRIWRELFAATTAMQRPLTVAVSEGAAAALAREQFGALVALRAHRAPADALHEVGSGVAAAAVLPMPGDDAAHDWWTALLSQDEAARRVHVVARLPFWAPRPAGVPRGQALVAAAIPPDPSGQDRTLLALRLPSTGSRAAEEMLASAGLGAGALILARDAPAGNVLADVDGFVAEDDPRLAAIEPRPVALGVYAVPVGDYAVPVGDPA